MSVLEDVSLCESVKNLVDNPNLCIPKWAFDSACKLLDLRYKMGAPSLWYMAWYVLSGKDVDESESVALNPFVVMQVCNFEWRERLSEMSVSPVEYFADVRYLDDTMVSRLLARKGLSHNELNRAQKLHVAFSITRPMYLASLQLGIAGSNSQMQRKWLPDVWVEYLVSRVFKLFVNQLIMLNRWIPDFISTNVVFASELHLSSVRVALSSVSVGMDPRALCVISHSDAVIFRSGGVDVPHEITWRGPIDSVVSAWIAGSEDDTLRAQTIALA